MSKQFSVIIPVPGLNEAEREYSDVAQMLGPYLESIVKNDFAAFYDGAVNLLPDVGDLEDPYSNKEKRIIENFDVLMDHVESALACIHLPDIKQLVPGNGYMVIDSKRYGKGETVILTVVPFQDKNKTA